MPEDAASFEDLRLAALYEYDVLDSQPEESFDRITRLVKVTLGTPIAVVSLVDRDRQWFKSCQGMDAMETPRVISFCTHTIQANEPLIVPDAQQDPRFRDSPLVTIETGIKFYLGVPLRTPSGFNIGALCAIDTKPREVSPEHETHDHEDGSKTPTLRIRATGCRGVWCPSNHCAKERDEMTLRRRKSSRPTKTSNLVLGSQVRSSSSTRIWRCAMPGPVCFSRPDIG